MATKLDASQKHILKLIRRESFEGWTKISKQLCKLVDENIPKDLIDFEFIPLIDFTHGRARLTPEGETVLDMMEWL